LLGQYYIAIAAMIGLCLFLIAIIKSFPTVFFTVHDKVGSYIKVEHLQNFLQKPKFIGVIGRQSVGKTTFVDACIGRPYEKKSTEKPYARIVALPNTDPTEFVALIDTVGCADISQFNIQAMSYSLVLFLDHSESSISNGHSVDRINKHKYLVDQLTKSLEKANKQKKIVVICNKSEIWSSQSGDNQAMATLAQEIKMILMSSGKYDVVTIIDHHSNMNTNDIASAKSLLKQL